MNKRHAKYLKASLAVAASGLSAEAAQAALVITDHNISTSQSVAGDGNLPFDVNADSLPDYQLLYANDNGAKVQITAAPFGDPLDPTQNQIMMPDASANRRVLPVLSGGTSIDASLYGGVGLNEAFFFQNYETDANMYFGDWGGTPAGVAAPDPIVGPIEGFVALKLPDGSGNFNYGWAQIINDQPNETITLVRTGYETEVNTSVVTPDLIPEPSTVALLVTGAAGVAALRRR